MDHIADLHIHSKYSAACSDKLTIANINNAAEEKGISVIGTGDFTHPKWLSEIKEQLKSNGNGTYSVNGSKVSFVLSSEVCTIFDMQGTKKIHSCVLAPSIEDAEEISKALSKHGNVAVDGRPVLMISAEEFAASVMDISPEAILFPAHIWTPWFGAIGAMSRFNSIEEAYGSAANLVPAYETGLSSDPPMNWRVSRLDRYAMLSNSDAHSLPKIGREATVFTLKDLSYKGIADSIKKNSIKMTVEFYPEEGKYHYDGHRNCKVSLGPEESKKYNGICPVCRRKLTVGVMHRVAELADREAGYLPEARPSYVHAVPLIEILSHITGRGQGTERVQSMYREAIKRFGTEMNALINAKPEHLAEIDKGLGEAMERIREGRIKVTPGYDGVFGVVNLLSNPEPEKGSKQKTINEF